MQGLVRALIGVGLASIFAVSAPNAHADRSAEEVLERDGVYFDLSFMASDVHDAAEKKCSKKAGDDLAKKAKCMSHESDAVAWNGMAFRRGPEGKWWWYTLRRTGAKMVPLHKIQIEFTDDSDHSVTLKTSGRDEGSKPGGLPSKVVIEVPSESQIVVTDRKYGKMVYNAKMGLFGKDER